MSAAGVWRDSRIGDAGRHLWPAFGGRLVVSAFGGLYGTEGLLGAAVGLLGPGQGGVGAYADGLTVGVGGLCVLSFGV